MCYLLSYRGKIPTDPAQVNSYNTLPPSKRRDLWGVRTVYIRLYNDLPASFRFLGNQGDVVFRCARASVSVKEAFEVRFEPVTWTTSNGMVLPTELYG